MVGLNCRTCAVYTGAIIAAQRIASLERAARASRHAWNRNEYRRDMADMGDDSVPEEIEEPCMQCHHSLSGIEQMLKPVLAVGRAHTEQQVRPVYVSEF